MMKRISRWLKGAQYILDIEKARELSDARTELLHKTAEFDRTRKQLRLAAEEVDRRLNRQGR